MNVRAIATLMSGATLDGVDCLSTAKDLGGGNAIEVETGLFLYGLLRRIKPMVVVETGTHWGYSSAWMATALQDNWSNYPDKPKPTLHTVDVNDYEGKPERLWEEINVSTFVKHHIMSSLEFIPPQVFDFAWLDADHGTEFVVEEWKKVVPAANARKALIGFHDTRLDPREAEGIKQILEQRVDPIPNYRSVQRITFRNLRGLDLIELSNVE